MNKRKEFLEYVKYGGAKPLCSPQIGCGAGYDSKICGLEWVSQTSVDHTISVTDRYPMHPLFNFGINPLEHCSEVKWEYKTGEQTDKKRITDGYCGTPYGIIETRYEERPKQGTFCLKNIIKDTDDLDKLEYFITEALKSEDCSCYTKSARNVSDYIGDRGAVSMQWSMQPYEMFSLPNTMTNVFLVNDYEDRFIRLMDMIVDIDKKIIDSLYGTGVDFLFLGGPAAEMISPAYYEKFIVPYSKTVTDYAHKKGFLIYSHICSPIEPMLSRGYYNEMGIDLFETLSPKPEGNIISFADALTKLSPDVCTRGNVSMSLLLTGSPEDVRTEVRSIIEAAAGRKHIIAASDYLMYDVPEENVYALCDEAAK